jgi:cytochrome b6-f complex iron-sulfur subunit
MNRRNALLYFLKFAFGAIGALVTWGMIRFISGTDAKESRAPVELNELKEIPVGAVKHLADSGAWLIHAEGVSQPRALDDRCTHLGCRFKWDKSRNLFHCPCHGSEFTKEGSILKGPAKKPLPRLYFKKAGENRVILVESPAHDDVEIRTSLTDGDT